MTPDPIIIRQRKSGDCGVACLAAWAGQSYEDAYVAVSQIDNRRSARGLTAGQLKRAASILIPDRVLRKRYKNIDLEEDEGILMVASTTPRSSKYHWVRLRAGEVLDPTDYSATPADEYMRIYDYEPYVLLGEL